MCQKRVEAYEQSKQELEAFKIKFEATGEFDFSIFSGDDGAGDPSSPLPNLDLDEDDDDSTSSVDDNENEDDPVATGPPSPSLSHADFDDAPSSKTYDPLYDDTASTGHDTFGSRYQASMSGLLQTQQSFTLNLPQALPATPSYRPASQLDPAAPSKSASIIMSAINVTSPTQALPSGNSVVSQTPPIPPAPLTSPPADSLSFPAANPFATSLEPGSSATTNNSDGKQASPDPKPLASTGNKENKPNMGKEKGTRKKRKRGTDTDTAVATEPPPAKVGRVLRDRNHSLNYKT
jgi:hypothetical protein